MVFKDGNYMISLIQKKYIELETEDIGELGEDGGAVESDIKNTSHKNPIMMFLKKPKKRHQ